MSNTFFLKHQCEGPRDEMYLEVRRNEKRETDEYVIFHACKMSGLYAFFAHDSTSLHTKRNLIHEDYDPEMIYSISKKMVCWLSLEY